MTKDQMIEELARKFEKDATACYCWTDEQFEIWWTKDRASESNRVWQRTRAKIAYEYFNNVIKHKA